MSPTLSQALSLFTLLLHCCICILVCICIQSSFLSFAQVLRNRSVLHHFVTWTGDTTSRTAFSPFYPFKKTCSPFNICIPGVLAIVWNHNWIHPRLGFVSAFEFISVLIISFSLHWICAQQASVFVFVLERVDGEKDTFDSILSAHLDKHQSLQQHIYVVKVLHINFGPWPPCWCCGPI